MEKGRIRIGLGSLFIASPFIAFIGGWLGRSTVYGIASTNSIPQFSDYYGYIINAVFIGIPLLISGIRAKNKHERKAIANEKEKSNLVNAVSQNSSIIMSFVSKTSKIPSDGAILNRLKELTALADDYTIRQLAAHWLHANDKLKELKSELSSLQNTADELSEHERNAKEHAQCAAKSFMLFLYEYDPKIKKCTPLEATEKLKQFLADIEPMYK